MAEIENRTKRPLIFPITGEATRKKEYRTVIPGINGGPPEVVPHVVEEKRTAVLKSVVVPPRVDGMTGVLELEAEDLTALKQNAAFMAAVKRGDINIRSHK